MLAILKILESTWILLMIKKVQIAVAEVHVQRNQFILGFLVVKKFY